MAMLDAVRKYVEAGREAISPEKAQELARSMARQGQTRADQVNRVARDLAEWSRRNSERLVRLIQREVKRQIANLGVATKEDVEGLKRRIRDLERARTAAPKRATAKPAATRSRSTAPKPPAAKPAPKAPGTRPPVTPTEG